MNYLEKLQALYADPATHNVAIALGVLWLRLEHLHRRFGGRLLALERRVFPERFNPPAIELASNRRTRP